MAIAVIVIALGAFIYAEMLLGDYPGILIIKAFTTLAFVPLMLGMLLGLLPRKALGWGILPWCISLILVGVNWAFFSKSWITIPDNNAASIIISFILLGIFVHLGTEMTKAMKRIEDSQHAPPADAV
ncbi:MAG: hypothetical protein M5U15_05235 [Kiritimatiellae bacterium]|nr:hypothetical protein [Kiritimatiellia bacterium]